MASTLHELLPILAELSGARDARRSLAELAAEADLSPHHFQRVFAKVVGESPKQYARRLALECAAVLLLTGNDSVLEVALAAGFDSHEGFTRAFGSHFGVPPSEFRRRAAASGLADSVRHAELLTHVGPCLRLYRAALSSLPNRGDSSMSYDITRHDLPELSFLHRSARCEHAKIGETLAGILPVLFQHAARNGIQLMSPPMTVYLAWGPGTVTLQAGFAVAPGAAAGDDVEIAVLPAGPAMVTIHTGPYDRLLAAHAAVNAHIHQHGLTAGGPPREIYLTDPGEVPDPAEWKTQIVWPLAVGG